MFTGSEVNCRMVYFLGALTPSEPRNFSLVMKYTPPAPSYTVGRTRLLKNLIVSGEKKYRPARWSASRIAAMVQVSITTPPESFLAGCLWSEGTPKQFPAAEHVPLPS